MGSKTIERTFKSSFLQILKPLLQSAPLQSWSIEPVRSVLVVRQHNELGDMLCCVPLLRALKQHMPEARVTLVASPVNYAIMLHNPYVEKVVLYDKRHPLRFLDHLKSDRFDLAVVPCTVSVSITSDSIAYFSRANIRLGVQLLNGAVNPSGYLHNVQVVLDWRRNSRLHQTARNLEILKPLGITTGDLSVVVGFTDAEKTWAKEFLKNESGGATRLIGYHPGAGKPSNRWPASRFAELANTLSAKLGARTVVTCGPKDRVATEEFLSRLDHAAVVVQDRTIREVAAIVDPLDLYVSNDTGVMHVAGGTSVPVLSLFGPTDPYEWAPIGEKNRFVISEDRTMNTLSVGAVTAAALELLENA